MDAWATEYQQKNPGKYEIERNAYLKRIDGIIYGEDPKQGFVENDYFYHPVLKFQFPVPRGWQHQNSPQQFQMAPKDGKAVAIFTLAQGNSLEEAAQTTLKAMGLESRENQKTTINGNPALVVVSRQAPQQQQQGQPQQQQTAANTVQVASWFIQYGGTIYVIHGMSYLNTFDRYLDEFKQIASGFRALTDRDKLNRQPDRIQIKSVQRDGTLRSALEAYRMPADKMKDLEILNGIDLKDQVTRGMLIKTIGR